MGSWDRLRELFSSKEPLRAHFDDPFIQIDRALASDRLKLDERGKGQGLIDLPPQSQVALDNVETEIITGGILSLYMGISKAVPTEVLQIQSTK